MSRTVDQIKQSIYAQIATKTSLAFLVPNPSQTSIWKDFIHCIAVCIAVFEQLLDVFKADIETAITNAPVHTTTWIRQKAFEFQYDAAVPQVIQLVNFVPVYNPVDVSKRIITVCCIRFSASRLVNILVAKSSPPVKLSTAELTAIQGYYTDGGSASSFGTGIGAAGIAHILISLDPDLVFMEAEIFYSGQYSPTIQSDVIGAIETYLADLGPTGVLNVQKLTDVVQGVPGVNDLVIKNLGIRDAGSSFPGSLTYLIQSFTQALKEQNATAGYAIGETTASNTFADKLTFTIG